MKQTEIKKDENKKPSLKWQRDRDREKVKGKFIFHECPGGTMSFVFKAYKGDPVARYDLKDGEIYSIPLGVARHLNKNCWYPRHHYQVDESGKPVMRIGEKVRRVSFQSLEFMDMDDLKPDKTVLTAEKVG
jgi:hypothetical protein